MSDYIQGGAVVELGPDAGSLTDYTCDVRGFVINDARTVYVKPASAGSPDVEELASAHKASVTMTFAAVPHASSGLWLELRNAQKSVTGELFFQVRFGTGAVSASNPRRTGYIKVIDLDFGAPAAQARFQTKEFPARSVSDPIAS